jgi:hypothetical protein
MTGSGTSGTPRTLLQIYQDLGNLPAIDVSFPEVTRDDMIDRFNDLHDQIDGFRNCAALEDLIRLETTVPPA